MNNSEEGAPRSKEEQAAARTKGDIRGWFGKLPRGQPPKAAQLKSHPPPQISDEAIVSPTKRSKRGNYTNWKDPNNFQVIKAALQGNKPQEDGTINLKGPTLPPISISTLHSVKKGHLQLQAKRLSKTLSRQI